MANRNLFGVELSWSESGTSVVMDGHLPRLAPLRETLEDSLSEMCRHVVRNNELIKLNDRSPILDRTLTPRDVFAVRNTFFAMNAVLLRHICERIATETGLTEIPMSLPLARLGQKYVEIMTRPALTGLREAQPFFLEGPAAAAFLDAEDPDVELLADMRLPYRYCLVFLAAPFEIAPFSPWFDPETIRLFQEHHESLQRDGHRMFDDDIFERTDTMDTLYRYGGRLYGVLLTADEHGMLADTVGWLLGSCGETGDDWMANVLFGHLSLATMAPLAHRLACAIAWAPWNEITPVDLDELAREKRFGKLRRVMKAPSAVGVHTINLSSRPGGSPHATQDERRTVRAHLRRGHWRRVRVATRRQGVIVGNISGTHDLDWHYEGRWIPPTMVGGAGQLDERRVYVLPDLPAPPQRPDPIAPAGRFAARSPQGSRSNTHSVNRGSAG